MTANPYPKYKDCEIAWLPKLPEAWGWLPLKYAFSVQLGKMLQNQQNSSEDTLEYYLNTSNVYWEGLDVEKVNQMWFSENEKQKYKLEEGDLVVCEGGDVGRCACYFDEPKDCYIQNAVHRVRSKTKSDIKFLYFLMFHMKSTKWIDSICSKSTFAHLTSEKLKAIVVPLPPLPEQTQIAAFLDHKCALIATAMQKKTLLIERLREQKQAIINRAVTKGIQPGVKMKDSGVAWLGEVPEHWEVKRLKHFCKIISKGTTPSTEGREFTSEGVRFLKAENIVEGQVSIEPLFFIDLETDEVLRRSRLQKNDILIVIAGATIGKIGIVTPEILPANTNQAVCFLRLKDANYLKYLHLTLQSDFIQKIVRFDAVQSAQPNLAMGVLGNFPIPTPPIHEQSEIVRYIEEESAIIEKTITHINREIDLLREYKTTLIAEAVTGKIDVRGWQK